MSKFIVAADHQVEHEGKMYNPGQTIPGITPKKDEALIESGLLTEVETPKAKPKATASADSKENKA